MSIVSIVAPSLISADIGDFNFYVNKEHRQAKQVKKRKADKSARINILNNKNSTDYFWVDIHRSSTDQIIGWKKINDNSPTETISLNRIYRNEMHYLRVARASAAFDNALKLAKGWYSLDLS
ncbi:hypothetical protein [Mycoplasma sp. P36-A1]|uniref:hypothetical protein n=1 Tax=Mycoplasma sp. P36-A1 TaxID=3252900 RepID=UPI003C2CAFCE